MGKRYHCDFCDKTFQDNLQSRRRHLRGLGHQQRRQQWYAAYRGEFTINTITYIITYTITSSVASSGTQLTAVSSPSSPSSTPTPSTPSPTPSTPSPTPSPSSPAASPAVVRSLPRSRLPQQCRCDFGQSCRFSHLNSEELQRLRDTVEDESGGYRGDADGPAPSLLQEWLQGHERRSGTRVDLPAGFPPPDQLPPSLRPPPLGGWPSEPLTQWG
ncbi:zinc finger matrin-type protein 5-like [Lampetra fluviatilis]